MKPIRLLILGLLGLPVVAWIDWYVWTHIFNLTLTSSLGHIIVWGVLGLLTIPLTVYAVVFGIILGAIGLRGD